MNDLITILKDIERHLSGGAALYPGSLIFAEDAPAVEVIRSAIERHENESGKLETGV